MELFKAGVCLGAGMLCGAAAMYGIGEGAALLGRWSYRIGLRAWSKAKLRRIKKLDKEYMEATK